jgi:hypothetical protein
MMKASIKSDYDVDDSAALKSKDTKVPLTTSLEAYQVRIEGFMKRHKRSYTLNKRLLDRYETDLTALTIGVDPEEPANIVPSKKKSQKDRQDGAERKRNAKAEPSLYGPKVFDLLRHNGITEFIAKLRQFLLHLEDLVRSMLLFCT